MNTITPDEEFYDVNVNFTVLLSEYKKQIQLLQEDLLVIQNPRLRGMAQKLYEELKIVRGLIGAAKKEGLQVDTFEYQKIAENNLKQLHDMGYKKLV